MNYSIQIKQNLVKQRISILWNQIINNNKIMKESLHKKKRVDPNKSLLNKI